MVRENTGGGGVDGGGAPLRNVPSTHSCPKLVPTAALPKLDGILVLPSGSQKSNCLLTRHSRESSVLPLWHTFFIHLPLV